MFITLVSSLFNSANANSSRDEKIQALKQENQKKEESIKIKSDHFIEDLRIKYPQFTPEHLEAMRLTFEENLLEDSHYSRKKGKSKQDDTSSQTAPKKTISKEKLQGKVSQLVHKNADKENSQAYKEFIDEAKITVVSLTVKKGDTLGDIAQRTYGDSAMYIAIYEENKDQLDSPNRVPEGIVLRVPKVDNSMQSKFAKLVKETQKKKLQKTQQAKLTKEDHSNIKKVSDHSSKPTKRSPEELQRLISEAVSDTSK